MTDAFESLRSPDPEVAVDAAWAGNLRGRILNVFNVSEPEPEPTMTISTITPYLAVADARAAIEFYVTALGAVTVDEPIVMPDGRIGHAELTVNGARLYLSDAHPEIGVTAPVAGESAVTLHLEVLDVDAIVEAATQRGATLDRPVSETPYGRQAVITDPSNHRWMLMSPPPAAAPVEQIHDGDLIYYSLWSADADRAAAFYSQVLGWSPEPGQAPDSYRVRGLTINPGIQTDADQPGVFCCYAVADLDAALTRVGTAGGSAGEPVDESYGRVAEVIDPQGVKFALWQTEPGNPRPAINGSVAGDLGYLTMEGPDDDATRSFYGTVLGWSFDDSGSPVDAAPMTGIAPVSEVARNVPCWLVRDIEAAVIRVREAGGTATDPDTKPYGRLATCYDNQGELFYLGDF